MKKEQEYFNNGKFRLCGEDLRVLRSGAGEELKSWTCNPEVDEDRYGNLADSYRVASKIGPIGSGHYSPWDTALYATEVEFRLAAAAPDLLHDLILAREELNRMRRLMSTYFTDVNMPEPRSE